MGRREFVSVGPAHVAPPSPLDDSWATPAARLKDVAPPRFEPYPRRVPECGGPMPATRVEGARHPASPRTARPSCRQCARGTHRSTVGAVQRIYDSESGDGGPSTLDIDGATTSEPLSEPDSLHA